MKKLIGIAVFLLILYGSLLIADKGARSPGNHYNLGKRIGLYGIISLGAGMLIITGGIDLSIGSVVGLTSTVLAMLLMNPKDGGFGWHPVPAIVVVLALGSLIGLINGLLVTRLRVQAFVVTLCGLFVYRGAARWVADEAQKGLGTEHEELKALLAGSYRGLPATLVILMGLLLVATVFLHFSVYGRYFYAIGSNERAARYSGIATDRYKVLAYVLCSGLAAFFAILFLMEQNSVQPSGTGNFLELYAIAGAVLGGCSLRGGEGTVVGICIGATILTILPNLTNMWGVRSSLEPTVIGGALLFGAVLDEILRRQSAAGGMERVR
jgi:ribose transport system permease protein